MKPGQYDDVTDEMFSKWLTGIRIENSSLELNILKSIYFYFRDQYKARINPVHQRALKYIQSKGLLDPGYYTADAALDREERTRYIIGKEVAEPTYYEDQIRYSITPKADHFIDLITLDQLSFNDIYETEFPKVARYVLQNGGTIELARDIFQDAIVILLEKIQNGRLGLTSSTGTYLYSVCRNIRMDHYRQSKRYQKMKENFQDDLGDDLDFPWVKPDYYDQVAEVIDTMGDQCKKLLEFFYYMRKDWGSIANSLGYKDAASARNQKYKCLEKIRNSLKTVIT